MLSSALIFLTVVAWADVVQEYLSLKDTDNLEDLTDPVVTKRRLALRLYRRLLFAALITMATFVIVWWVSGPC